MNEQRNECPYRQSRLGQELAQGRQLSTVCRMPNSCSNTESVLCGLVGQAPGSSPWDCLLPLLCGSRVCGVGDYRLVGKVFCFPQYCVPSVLRPAAPRLWGGCCFKLGLCSPRHLSLDLEGSIAQGMLNLGVVEILMGKA